MVNCGFENDMKAALNIADKDQRQEAVYNCMKAFIEKCTAAVDAYKKDQFTDQLNQNLADQCHVDTKSILDVTPNTIRDLNISDSNASDEVRKQCWTSCNKFCSKQLATLGDKSLEWHPESIA